MCVTNADAVKGQVGEVLQEGAEAVDRLGRLPALARGLAACGAGDSPLGRCAAAAAGVSSLNGVRARSRFMCQMMT